MGTGWRPVVAGAADGAAGTLAMSGVMLAAQRAGWMGGMPPRRITGLAARRAGAAAMRRGAKDRLAAVNHLAFGAAAGALFEAAYWRWGGRGLGPAAGAAFGAAIWLVSYAGWVPALRILPPPHRDRPGRQAWMLVAHLVFGAVLGALADRRAAGAELEEWWAGGSGI